MIILAADGSIIHDMFSLSLPIAEKIIRPIIVYFFLVVFLRVFGKRELAQLNPFDLVVLLSLSNTVQNAIIGDDNTVSGGLIGAFALLLMNYIVVRFLFKHRRLDQIFEGTPTVLVDGGCIQKDALAKEMLTESELKTVAHKQGFSDVDEIEKCVLEPGGTFFIKGKTPGTDDIRHNELMSQIKQLSIMLDDLKAEVKAKK
jgi:uncharacterized membrane protein YcaP (DUF421 family)